MANKSRVFYGWIVVAVTTLCMSTGTAPFLFASLGLFFQPFSSEFGWDRAQISAVIPVLIITVMITQPFAGRIIDRIGVRKILIPSVAAFGLLIAAIPTWVSEIWQLGLVFFLIGTLGVGSNTMPYMRIITAWFDRKRGLAIGISVSGIGLGYTYVPLLVQSTIDAYDWRTAYYMLSFVVLFVAVPLMYFFLKESPADMGLSVDGDTGRTAAHTQALSWGMGSGETIRQKEFWLMALIFLLISFNLHGLLPHLVPMLSDHGINSTTAARIASCLGLTVFVSRIFIGYLLDIYFAPTVAAIFFALSALGFIIFSTMSTIPMMFLAAILVGLSLGAEVDILTYLIGKYFGLRSFAEIFGLLFVGIFIGSALGPPAFGVTFETTGSYIYILGIAIVSSLIALYLTLKLGPYPVRDSAGTAIG